jgi:hypothetical protein
LRNLAVWRCRFLQHPDHKKNEKTYQSGIRYLQYILPNREESNLELVEGQDHRVSKFSTIEGKKAKAT